MPIFKLIKEKIKLRKKTKEERIDLLLSGKNTLLEVSQTLKHKILIMGFICFAFSLSLFPVYLLFTGIGFLIFDFQIFINEMVEKYGNNIMLIAASMTLASLPLLFYISLKFLDKKDLLCGLFENVKLPYLVKNAKKINSYILENNSAKAIHEVIFNNHSYNDKYYDFLCADIENSDIFFYYLKSNHSLVFEHFCKIRKTLIEKKDNLSSETLDTLYNNKFLNDDLDSYIRHGRSDFDKDILDYLNIYGCRTDIHTHFKNKNSKTEPVKSIENKASNIIDFDLLNKKANVYANF